MREGGGKQKILDKKNEKKEDNDDKMYVSLCEKKRNRSFGGKIRKSEFRVKIRKKKGVNCS